MYNIFVEIPKNLSDDEIVLQIQKGNSEYLPALFGRYFGIIHKKASKWCGSVLDSDDFAQEGFIALYHAAMSYDYFSASFSTYANVCIDHAVKTLAKKLSRKRRIPEQMITSLNEVDPVSTLGPETQVIERETVNALFSEIKSVLSDFEYKVFAAYLTYYDYNVISEKLDVSVKSVSNALCRIRQKLKTKLAGNR